MPEQVMTWEADEVRGGLRKIPGYSGHVPGLRNTVGTTYGTCSAEVLQNAETDALRDYPSCILRHRRDGFTTPGHADYPFPDEIYRANYAGKSRIIAGYAGHAPLWTHTYGASQGKYGTQAYTDFTTVTRKLSKTLRVPYKPEDIMALPDPPRPPPRDPLYPRERFYIPGTTCYSPAINERFGEGFPKHTLSGFLQPVPRVLDPLSRREDSKAIDQLSLISGYAGFRPRVFPQIVPMILEHTVA